MKRLVLGLVLVGLLPMFFGCDSRSFRQRMEGGWGRMSWGSRAPDPSAVPRQLLPAAAEAAIVCTPLGTLTPNLELCKPSAGELNWDAGINNNMTVLDALMPGALTAGNGKVLIGNGAGFTLANITGTTDEIVVTNGPGSITLSTPQTIATTSTPQFAGLNIGAVAATPLAGSLFINATTFAALGTPSNGVQIFCSDCTFANPCAGAGTGAIAKRLNSAWRCD